MISVITPVYNGEQFVAACIQGVIDQQCPDVEHIIIDGGSNDQTVEMIQRYAAQHPHIRWISEKDQGQSDAMNKGIAMARGEILGILNVDDDYEANVLNRITEIFKSLPEPSFVVGNCNVWDGDGSLLFVNQPRNLKLSDLLLGWNVNPIPANPAAYFYHTSLHNQVGLYRVDEHCLMDLQFILEAVQIANVIYIDETWGNFRLHQTTKTFQSLQTREVTHRVRQMLRHYRQKLPLHKRLWVAARFESDITKQQLSYIFENPRDLPQLLKNKLERAFS
jgi:glycosyltransferase involved in cell wall biosynthesis